MRLYLMVDRSSHSARATRITWNKWIHGLFRTLRLGASILRENLGKVRIRKKYSDRVAALKTLLR